MDNQYYLSLSESLMALDGDRVKRLVEEGIAAKTNAVDIIDGLVAGLRIMGEKFEQGEIFIPHLMVAAEITAQMTDFLKPHLGQTGSGEKKRKVVICTVEGDVHELGKNLVATMLSVSNYDVVDLGRDVPNAKVVEAVLEHEPNFLYLSALMTTTMIRQQEIIETLKGLKVRDRVKIVVGGAPISQQWCDKIGADGYGMDAVEAVHVADRMGGARC